MAHAQSGMLESATRLLPLSESSSPTTVFEPETFDELLSATSEQLATADIARVNLLCATGLRGAENLDIPECLAKLDRWAEEVRQFTAWNFLHVFKPRTPRDTPGFFRCWSLVKLLRHHKGLQHALTPPGLKPGEKYISRSTGRGKNSTYYSSDSVFIHGLLGERKLGLCTTFPVLYAAVGRRLGYPLKVALSVSYVFNIWDDPADSFNIDAGKFHIAAEPDEHFIDTPRPWTDEEKNCGALLRPLNPVEEFGLFLGWRAIHLEVNGRYEEAIELCDMALRLFPNNPVHPWIARRIETERVRVFMEEDGWGYEPEDDEPETDEMLPQPPAVGDSEPPNVNPPD